MADETKVTNTSDAALNATLEIPEVKEPAKEEPVTETQTPEGKEEKSEEVKTEKPEGETDQQFRSKLGRRLSKMEEETGKKIDQLSSIVQQMSVDLNSQNALRQPDNGSQYVDDGEYVTKSQVEKVALDALNKSQQQKEQAVYEYNESYLDTVARLGTEEGLNDIEFTRLEELIKTSFSKKTYKDPVIDAKLNYAQAMRVIEREKLQKSTKTVNLKGDTPKATGVSTTTQIVEKSEPEVKLDEHAAAFVNWAKMDSKKVNSVLRGETPLSLRNKG